MARAHDTNELLFYRDLGEKTSAHTVVLIHGDFSDGAGTWDRQMTSEALLSRCRLIVVDRRGAGQSPVEPRPYTIRSEALDVLALLDALEIEGCHIAGHSYGGLIAIELTTLARERVASLHLIEPPFLALLPDDPDVRVLRESTGSVADRAAQLTADEMTAAFFSALMGEEAVLRIREKPVWASLVKEAKRYGMQQRPDAYPPDCLNVLVRELESAAKRPPVVLYTGGRSHPALQKVTRLLAAEIPDCSLVEVPEAGHSVQHSGDTLERSLLSTF